ncbi:MBL fold metallo-hydrolase [Streptacidiphilus sp. PB12-B1b]|uniref:MBL fold metallo-hydrolase n=1 Tax=Streptacidiphilus sp. PB12-B1b TaxID=2705012 RepID=UPI0015FD2727|nr:MBL fold metallo-hydrolase [Streptacidiphilus sp. PB12-B1b]QMU76039.1 MBL fold metallo-hydrolase [Streptacidiphilus sp. PB12-B1b]
MRLTKFGHACVRLEKDGGVLVLDPGVFSEADALDGADAVLITHEHADHFEEARLRAAAEANPALVIWTNGAVADQLTGLGEGRVRRVGHGDAFTAAGFDVEVHGEWHAEIHPEIPRIGNVGFAVDGEVFHPGDALTVPEREIGTLLLPVHAPWSKTAEVVDYARAVGASRAFALHDVLLSEVGLGLVQNFVGMFAKETDYRRLAPGESVDLG